MASEPSNLIQAFTFPLISEFSFHFRFFLSSSIFDSWSPGKARGEWMSKTVRMCPDLQIGDGGGDDAQIAAKSRNSGLTRLPPEFLICNLQV
ncbi:hypothetical protein SLEP1_g37947 [Rubroshorea leprosula]|uniref:Uncharacterized protein n=1 Tax=Rubroshorea leprosula TaxID=152421 RepID=A0AAV5KWJ1_9ROSI|nr:hypothetical protein SLEP1_g37947 [Rubroshorea leprosula]